MKNSRKLLAIILVVLTVLIFSPSLAMAAEQETKIEQAPLAAEISAELPPADDLPEAPSEDAELAAISDGTEYIIETEAVEEAEDVQAAAQVTGFDISTDAVTFSWDGSESKWLCTPKNGFALDVTDNSASTPFVITQTDAASLTTSNNILIDGMGSDAKVLYLQLEGINIKAVSSGESPIKVENGGNLDILLSGINKLDATDALKKAALQVETGNTVNIRAKTGLSDTLEADGGDGAGIGGSENIDGIGKDCGTVSISGGTVSASSNDGAGIGGAFGKNSFGDATGGSGGNIEISGGEVIAVSNYGAGIGGGSGESGNGTGTGGSGGNIKISGGIVTAKSEKYPSGAGIGGGSGHSISGSSFGGAGGSVEISGGTVSASSNDGAGIGGGYGDTLGVSGTLKITGGSVGYSGVSGSAQAQPTNGSLPVYKTTMLAGTDAANAAVTEGSIGSIVLAKDYGIKDVKTGSGTEAGKLYFWLPSSVDERPINITIGSKMYVGKVKTVTNNTSSTALSKNELDLVDGAITFSYSAGNWQYQQGAATGPIAINDASTAFVVKQTNASTLATANNIIVNGTSSGTNVLYLQLDGVNIDTGGGGESPIEIGSNANVDILLSGTNRLDATAESEKAALNVGSGNSVSIRAKTGVIDRLEAIGANGAGIGGNAAATVGHSGGTIKIRGGTVTAESVGSAGIGGGQGYSTSGAATGGAGGSVEISGGRVTAISNRGAGIGGGQGDSTSGTATGGAGGSVEISGGTVTVISNEGAGIGGGYGDTLGAPGSLQITGGSVNFSGTDNGMQARPKAGSSNVYKTTLTLSPPAPNVAVIAGQIGTIGLAAQYGIKDVFTDGESKLYFWFTQDPGRDASVVAGVDTYRGKAVTTEDNLGGGTLKRVPSPSVLYDVTYKYMDDATADKIEQVKEGFKAVKPADPVRKGYSFEGWYTDSEYKTKYDFEKLVNKALTLYAKWLPVPQNLRATHPAYSVTDKLTLRWDAAEKAESYIICSGDGKEIARVTGTAKEMTGLQPGKKYSYTVTAVISGENCRKSAMLVTATRPPKPQEIKYTKKTVRSVTLAWEAVEGANYYRMYCKEGDAYKLVETVKGKTSYSFTGLAPGSKNYFKVVPVIRVGGVSIRGDSENAKAQTLK